MDARTTSFPFSPFRLGFDPFGDPLEHQLDRDLLLLGFLPLRRVPSSPPASLPSGTACPSPFKGDVLDNHLEAGPIKPRLRLLGDHQRLGVIHPQRVHRLPLEFGQQTSSFRSSRRQIDGIPFRLPGGIKALIRPVLGDLHPGRPAGYPPPPAGRAARCLYSPPPVPRPSGCSPRRESRHL